MAAYNYNKCTQEALENTIKAISNGLMKLMNAAKQFGVPDTTLFDKLHNRTPMEPSARTVLTTHEEERLVNWLKMSARPGSGKARKDLAIVVQQIFNVEGGQTPFKGNLPGRKWLQSFLKCHKKLRERKTMVLREQRAGLSKEKKKAWFKEIAVNLSEDGIDISSVEPDCIFNADETGFPFHTCGEIIITEKADKHPYTLGSDIEDQISAAVQQLRPMVIYPGVRKSNSYDPGEDFPLTKVVRTKNGRMNTATFQTCLEENFVHAVKDLPRPVVLFCDRHTRPSESTASTELAVFLDKYTDFIISTGWKMSALYLIRRRQYANKPPKEGLD
ncbi:hypothetical protein PoB_003491200 [Plakobranchus ocellatus]|uniref:HTH CENPB-type domain-containing protein n=1 Tax=Plakobranchus ocellatus TaxID=259542 RepID=A0AAV4AMB2_9GAST|nr:hypothetical protein PoB_003491200 [Plakobranchus ocellatus]